MKKKFDLKTIIALIGIIVPIIIFAIMKKTKELSFKNVAINELVSGENITDESITVYFDNERIFNLYSVSSILSNSGNVPILKEDFVNGLTLSFHDSVKILKYSIIKNPKNITLVNTSINKSDFMLLPDLLNPNENIELSFYISSSLKSLLPYCNSRIIGGDVINLNINDEIKPKTNFKNNFFANFEGLIFWIALIYSFMYLLLFIISVYFAEKDTGVHSPLGKLILLLALSLGSVCCIFYLIQTWF